jgi:hypothetical protein
MSKIDLTGRRFTRLRVLDRADKKRWRCVCDCGTEKAIAGASLRRGLSRSCGCLQRQRSTTHGLSSSPEYRAYHHAKERCTNPRCQKFKSYGARGVKFRFTSFQQFLAALGPRPSPQHSLDRFNDGDYAPGEVVWASKSQQRQTQRCMANPNQARQKIVDIRSGRASGMTQRELAAQYQVSRSFIGSLLSA